MDCTIETISEELMEFRELIETLSPLENYLSPSAAQHNNINGKTPNLPERGFKSRWRDRY